MRKKKVWYNRNQTIYRTFNIKDKVDKASVLKMIKFAEAKQSSKLGDVVTQLLSFGLRTCIIKYISILNMQYQVLQTSCRILQERESDRVWIYSSNSDTHTCRW